MDDLGLAFKKACIRLCKDLSQDFTENNIILNSSNNRSEYNFTTLTEKFKVVFTLTSESDDSRAFANIAIYHNTNVGPFHISSPQNLEKNKLVQIIRDGFLGR